MVQSWNQRADELSAAAAAQGRPTSWFETLYAEGDAGVVSMPWDREEPHPLLREWIEAPGRHRGGTAVVVGCGLGADAEYLAGQGFVTSAFDLSETALRVARSRHPDSTVDYCRADLLALPEAWSDGFDLVVEIFTLQAMPDPPRTDAARGVRSLVASGGTLLAVQFRYDGSEPADVGPPFPQTEEAMRALATDGLDLVELEALDGPRWRGEYRRLA
jgi:Thiopurine S-methyltransferase (TPMT)